MTVSQPPIVFGTDGWRARIGEDYTYENVRRCAQGVAEWAKSAGTSEKGVVIAYDRRFASEFFAQAAAEVLLAYDIPVAMSQTAVPTQMTSYEVVARGAACGIMITASHNPYPDNGFKVKSPSGAAASPDMLAVFEKTIRDNAGTLPPTRSYAEALAAAAGALALAAVTTHPGPLWTTVLAIVVGGSAAGLVHLGKASARLGSSTLSLGIANPLLSVVEDLASGALAILAVLVPVLALLLLALLLWPLDVGIRRVSVSRGDLALARAWTGARWRAWRGPARRTEQVGEMLAAKGRAGGAASRAALLRRTEETPTEPTRPTPPAPTPPPPPTPAPAATPPTDEPASPDTIARLREAKERRRGG